MRVRVNSLYVFEPVLWDVLDAKTDLSKGDVVRVVNLRGCPPANTMNHCHVANPYTGEFIGMVHCNSLSPASKGTKEHIRKGLLLNKRNR
jgi:hypothetical protein